MSNSKSHLLRLFFSCSLLILATPIAHAASSHAEFLLDNQGYPLEDPRYAEIRRWHELEQKGLAQYNQGEFSSAYDSLKIPAEHGFKRAQHAIALMHLQGQGVDKDLLVGVALLGLVAENKDRSLQRQFKKALAALPAKYRSPVRAQVTYYVDRWGMDVQGISCRSIKPTGSNLKQRRCVKQPGTYATWPWAPK